MNEPTLDEIENIAVLREQGDLRDYFLALTGRAVKSKPQPVADTQPADPGYTPAHPGGWPIGSAPAGPTPTHGRCACIKCDQAAVVHLPARIDRNEEAA